ncbi:MAG TPA: hypothetical protein VEM58_10695 [Streptosporangiaceae bacterium]|nr:hypothetical protein [Streptosporangiaceae bacterium]
MLQLTGLDAVAHRPAGGRFVDANARKDVLVRSPQASDLVRLLVAQGATVRPAGDGGLAVTGMGAPLIADLAAGQRIAVHELTPRHASLEDAYLDLTSASTDYRAGTATPGTAPPGADRTGAARTGAGS